MGPNFIFLSLFFICYFSSLIGNPCPSKGKLIIFAGLSGSGKSTLAKEVAKKHNAVYFLEPEESSWPEFVRNPQSYGELSSLLTIRSIRVHGLWNAWQEKMQGKLVFVDSYYDKINKYIIGQPGMEWLLDPKDPYFPVAVELTKIDNDILPNADLIILIDTQYEDWIAMLDSRGRTKDSIPGFRENYAAARKVLFEAVNRLSEEKGIPLLYFKNNFSSVDKQVDILSTILQHEGILP